MKRILAITIQGFFRKERLSSLPTATGVGMAFRGVRREEGVCNIVRFVSAFKCDNLKQEILSYSQKTILQVPSDSLAGEVDYYAYALLNENEADVVARVLTAKMGSIVECASVCENTDCDMSLLLEGAVPLIWNDKKAINFKSTDFLRDAV